MSLGVITSHRIRRAPVRDGSYVDVAVVLESGKLVNICLQYIGGELSGRAALTPTVESLQEVIGNLLPQAAKSILQDIASATEEWPAYAANSQHLRSFGPRPPICPRVVVGQPLWLRLPVACGVSSLKIGKVQEITLHSA